jgi:hypothetical protein
MARIITYLVSIISLALFLSSQLTNATPIPDTLESPEWFLNRIPAPCSASLSYITDSLIPFLSVLYHRGYEENPQGVWKVDTVGVLGGQVVLDICKVVRVPNWEQRSDTVSLVAIKAIGIEMSPGFYRLTYLSWNQPADVYFEPSYLINLFNTNVLVTCSQTSGTGHFMDEAYWTWDSLACRPRDLGEWEAIERGRSRVSPPNHFIYSGGHFDVRAMTFDTYTWREKDGRTPRGGRLIVKLEIRNGRAYVSEASFDFGDLYETSLWNAQRSADSMYLKQPKRVSVGDTIADTISDEWKALTYRDYVYESGIQERNLDSLVNVYARGVIEPEYNLARDKYPFFSRMDTVGFLHAKPFVEIPYWYHCPTCRDTLGKIVAVETSPKRFRPLYVAISTPLNAGIGQNAVLVIGGDTVIAAKGCENYVGTYADNYWVWPKESPAPIPLFQEWVLSETLTRIAPKYLPTGLTARIHKGNWDFEKLSYETYTWEKDDPDNAPSGGRLFIQFGLKNHRLQPIDITFDSTAVSPSTN